jgi:glycosyltransferase involved in cell wall biosynthesis
VFVGPDVPTESPVLAPFLQRRTNLPTARPIVRILWEQLALPLALARMRLDLLHSPAYVVPLVGKVPAVVTFHDLSFFVMPSAFNRQNRLYLQAMARQSARHAARFIAVSQATRRDLVRILGVREDQVDVVYNGVDDTFQPIADEARLDGFRAQYDLPRRFILYLGTLEPRKNVAALVRAYAVARQRGVTEPLILAGGRGWGDLALGQLIAELDLQDVVRMVGFVEMSDQALWYNAATLFVYPSLYEGFGFPVLEAMACGTPVLASDRSSLPEVVGDAGLVVDPMNPDSLAESMVTLLGDDDLRVRFRALGLERARTFRWDAAARQTVESYHRALSAS